MANYYFEISDLLVEEYGGKYFAVTNKHIDQKLSGRGWNMLMHSERVWRDEGDVIRYIKNRSGNMFSDIDEREFMWIKLSSKVLDV